MEGKNGSSIPMRWIAFFLVVFFLFLAVSPVAFAQEKETATQEKRIVRVGYPIQKGLTEIAEDGSFQGYTYDYLMELGQYTHWEYEFVQVEGDENTQITTLITMLEQGQIDLMGGMAYRESMAEKVDYASNSYGMAYTALCALESNAELTSANYFKFNTLRVAVLSFAEEYNNKLDQFAQMNGLNVERVVCENDEEQLAALQEGRADALLGVDIAPPFEGLKTVVRFSPQPFYFVVSKESKGLLNDLNTAISSVDTLNPYYTTTLHEKYFSMQSNMLILSEEEKAYIKNHAPLRVAMLDRRAPYQYRDKKTGEMRGLSKDILDYIAEETGLQFEIVSAHDYEEYSRIIQEEKIDLLLAIPSHYKLLHNESYSLSIPYISAQTNLAVNSKVDPSDLEEKRLALVKGTEYQGEYQGKVTYFDAMEDCLDAVERGEMDYTYGNSYSMQYYLNSGKYNNIITIPQSGEWNQQYCFGLLNPVDSNLVSIMNKAIQSIPEEEILRSYLYANAFQPEEVTLLSYVVSNPAQAVLIVVISVLLIIILLLLWNHRNVSRSNRRKKVENARYEQISALSNEFLYEYDILQDTLTMSEKSAQFLGCQKMTDQVSQKGEGASEEDLFSYIVVGCEGSVERIFCLPNGSRQWLKVISKTVADSAGRPIYSIGKIVDIQKEKKTHEDLLEKAQRDSMTGLYNAATFRQIVTEPLEQGDTGALFIVDIDHFKSINDTYGHYIGDRVLQEVARVFQSTFRQDDVVGRLGGDEFTIFLPHNQKRDSLANKCRSLQQSIQNLPIPELKEPICISIGVALSKPGQSFDELYQQADQMLYAVKQNGRNGFAIQE